MKSQNHHLPNPPNRRSDRRVIGLMPAAGQANRVAPLPCSKELYPVGLRKLDDKDDLRPKVACHYLLEKMQLAGVNNVYIVLRPGKWDIPAYLGDGSMLNMHIAYLMMGLPFGTPFSLDQAYPFVQDGLVAFGFPDIIFGTDDAFVQLVESQAATNAEIVLGLLCAEKPEVVDMVDVDDDWLVRSLHIKPSETSLKYTWVAAVWTSVFTRFMHNYLADLHISRPWSSVRSCEKRELSMGQVLQGALAAGLKVTGVPFPGDTYLDIGTSDNLVEAVRRFWRGLEG